MPMQSNPIMKGRMPLDTTSFSPTSRRAAVRRVVLAILAVVLLAYASAILWLVTQETRLVFQAGRPLGELRPAFSYEQIDIPREDGARQFGWMMKQADANAAWLLYLHGNAATIASRTNIAHYTQL